jgi:hypothetical protein
MVASFAYAFYAFSHDDKNGYALTDYAKIGF